MVKNIGVESEEEVNEITFWYDSKLIRGEMFYAQKSRKRFEYARVSSMRTIIMIDMIIE